MTKSGHLFCPDASVTLVGANVKKKHRLLLKGGDQSVMLLPEIFFQGFQVVFIPAMGTADFDGVNQHSIQLHF